MIVGGAPGALLMSKTLAGILKGGLVALGLLALIPLACLLFFGALVVMGKVRFSEPTSFHHSDSEPPPL